MFRSKNSGFLPYWGETLSGMGRGSKVQSPTSRWLSLSFKGNNSAKPSGGEERPGVLKISVGADRL